MYKHIITLSMAVLLCLVSVTKTIADDTAIYGISSVVIEPNVMILLDNSGSMQSKDVPGDPYAPAFDYTSYVATGKTTYTKDAVYYYNKGWIRLTTNKDNITCSAILADLVAVGYATYSNGQGINTKSLACGTNKPTMRLGNFLNYENSTLAAKKYRFEVAKASVAKILDNTSNKRFGLMHFNSNSEGGYVKYPCGSDRSVMSTYVKGMIIDNFNTNTPLAETLSEIGRYYAGLSSWFNTGVSYTSPIEHSCQKNYVIIVTDGEPTSDTNSKLYKTLYINNKVIGDYYIGPLGEDVDFNTSGSLVTSLLNDVASFLYNEDVHTMGVGTSYVKQNIITHTIGFTTNSTANDLLDLTAYCGGGDFYSASSSSGLDAALEEINNKIDESNAIFLAPAVPVNRTTRTSQSDWLYLAYFRPQNTGEWVGNIKKFAIGDDGKIYGSDGSGNVNTGKPVVDEYGMIDNNACSFWTQFCNDGNEVLKGGVGSLLSEVASADRDIYYYTGGTEKDLSNSTNAFTTTNASLSIADTVIESVRKFIDTTVVKWKLGAVIHSEPAIVHYTQSQSVIYVGANDGMLHCFDDNTGQELWGFIPPGQKTNIETKFTDANHDYYVDGSPTVSYGGLITGTHLFQPQYLIVGERRGGDNYYVLDISDYNHPTWKYQIESDYVTGEALGQSWSKPRVCTIATNTETVAGKVVPQASSLQKVFMIAGGYDVNQDLDTPAGADSMGKAIYTVQMATKAKGKFVVTDLTTDDIVDKSGSIGSYMKNCIVDINAISQYRMSSGTEITTRVYAGDLGGKVFTFADDRTIEKGKVKYRVPDGTFPMKNYLFNTGGKEIFYAPATSRIENSYEEWVVFGTGDREDPLNTTEVNRIYVVKNTWLKSRLTESNLADLTQNLIEEGTADEQKATASDIESKDGWYITFYDPGEKMISSPIIVQDYIFFTTYVPSSGSVSASDPCKSVGAAGASYLWAIDLNTGKPAYDVDLDGKKKKPERRFQVATMAQPKLIGTDMVSTPRTINIPQKIAFDYIFWRQL